MAGPSQSSYQPPAAVRKGGEAEIKNVSTGMTRPLYTSCAEHHLAQERIREQKQRVENERRDSSGTRQGRPRFLTLNTLPRMPSTSPAVHKRDTMPSPFMRLPTEIRLQIYALLVLPRKASDLLPSYQKVTASTIDYFDYDKKQTGSERAAVTADLSHPFIHIRTIDPKAYKSLHPPTKPSHTRSTYSVRADRFQARCMSTTYHAINNPRLEDNLSILGTCKQIHAEAAELLYSSYTFDFDTHIEALIPFLSDLTPFARSCIKNLRIVKRALPYCKEFDKCEWSNALRYLTSTSNNISLRRLELGVVAGRPGENGWDRVARYSAGDFELLHQLDGMEWMQYLLEVQGLQELDVQAVVEHCPPVTSSSAMASYVRFSASVEGGFGEFLRGRLLGARNAVR
ncbi:hypothetical protein M409DRAFT_22119 [Zasmidium cellare ATCC 36951]|uniref:DUF7730 domain-containing protein n=1 Tax=Zasmidium cellare ATCC 36951 TaxID=1080233 RepID=A0A6A6CL86_ZASCE|nr:uncharacterized protein M409DRAFT_22119 [Zasmidium cellare ATCC 36951]KAF2167974.1 hypothetical protein M409DRAFT_22119 [Zasmidium cellare ATCC 36951]